MSAPAVRKKNVASAFDPSVATIFTQSDRKEMPSCATICAFIHIEIDVLSDQFALMHAHFLGRTAGRFEGSLRPTPKCKWVNGSPDLAGRRIPAAFGFAGPAEAG
jgi:hypothetical protein